MDERRYESLLTPLGAFLASQDAMHVEILDQGVFLLVTWHDAVAGPVQRAFYEDELLALRPVAGTTIGVGSRAILLGQLAREIDAAQLSVARIVEGLEWFLVTGSRAGRYESWRFPYHELQARGGITMRTASQMLRAVPPAPAPTISQAIRHDPVPIALARTQSSPIHRRLQHG